MKKILLGNEAMARGLLENGCSFAASYPGTPASEILSSFIQMAKAVESPAMGEWSINEKVAYETALSVSYAGGRAAVSMKQVGLNVACDPLMSSAYTGVKGGFLVISADDPGPQKSEFLHLSHAINHRWFVGRRAALRAPLFLMSPF